MPCSGKTTIGKLLSKTINYKFIDTDELIEVRCNSSIKKIMNSSGEKHFRSLERILVEELISSGTDNAVISTGGGLPVFNNNLGLLKKLGLTIFLNTPMEILVKRAQKQDDRPLLEENATGRIKDLYIRRIGIYKESDIEISTADLSTEEIICAILKSVGKT